MIESDKLILEGKIVQRLECRPYGSYGMKIRFVFRYGVTYVRFVFSADSDYMKLKLESFRKAHQPVRLVKQLDKVVQNYKPVSTHKHLVSFLIVFGLVRLRRGLYM